MTVVWGDVELKLAAVERAAGSRPPITMVLTRPHVDHQTRLYQSLRVAKFLSRHVLLWLPTWSIARKCWPIGAAPGLHVHGSNYSRDQTTIAPVPVGSCHREGSSVYVLAVMLITPYLIKSRIVSSCIYCWRRSLVTSWWGPVRGGEMSARRWYSPFTAPSLPSSRQYLDVHHHYPLIHLYLNYIALPRWCSGHVTYLFYHSVKYLFVAASGLYRRPPCRTGSVPCSTSCTTLSESACPQSDHLSKLLNCSIIFNFEIHVTAKMCDKTGMEVGWWPLCTFEARSEFK